MNVYKVDFEYTETGYIPNVVAADEAAAQEGANVILKKQGISAKIVKVTDISTQDAAPQEAGKLN